MVIFEHTPKKCSFFCRTCLSSIKSRIEPDSTRNWYGIWNKIDVWSMFNRCPIYLSNTIWFFNRFNCCISLLSNMSINRKVNRINLRIHPKNVPEYIMESELDRILDKNSDRARNWYGIWNKISFNYEDGILYVYPRKLYTYTIYRVM